MHRITSYNVCYTKLLRVIDPEPDLVGQFPQRREELRVAGEMGVPPAAVLEEFPDPFARPGGGADPKQFPRGKGGALDRLFHLRGDLLQPFQGKSYNFV